MFKWGNGRHIGIGSDSSVECWPLVSDLWLGSLTRSPQKRPSLSQRNARPLISRSVRVAFGGERLADLSAAAGKRAQQWDRNQA